jgi:hypothetical protein
LTTLAIARWLIRLDCDAPALTERIIARYAAFVVPDVDVNDAEVTIVLDPMLPSGPWRNFPVIRQGDVCTLDVPGVYGRIGLNSLQASLRVGTGDVEAAEVTLEYFLEVLCSYLAFRQGGLLLHGAALFLAERVHVFVGLGGRGKSTVVMLSPHATALNDDYVILRPVGTGWWAFGTPFWNPAATRRDGQTAEGPVGGIYSLAQDRQVYLEPLPIAVATSELVANCSIVNTDPFEVSSVMERCRHLADAVPVQCLHFRKAPGFWDLLV